MTKRTIIEMAREVGIIFHGLGNTPEELEAFAALVREDERNRTWTQQHWTDYERSIAAAEREACERAIEELLPDADRGDCAAAIRARGQA
jgi:hypothetical protein